MHLFFTFNSKVQCIKCIWHLILIFFREEYGEDTTAFLFVSDDMEWAKNNEIFREEKNLFFEGMLILFIYHSVRILAY